MTRLSILTALLAAGLSGHAQAQATAPAAGAGADVVPTAPSEQTPGMSTATALTIVPEELVRGETAPVLTVPGIAIGTVSLEPGPGVEGAVSVSAAMDAAIKSGFLGQILSGRPYTIFMPSNAALEAVPQDALAAVFEDPDRMSEVMQGYVIEGNVDTDAAIALAREGGGQVSVESVAGSPIVIAVEGDALTVNGARVIVPNLGYAGLVTHIIDGAFLPGQPAAE